MAVAPHRPHGRPVCWVVLSSSARYGDRSTDGRPTGSHSQLHRCSRSGHPRRIGWVPILVHPAHRPLYIAAKTAAPQLIWGISSTIASAIFHPWVIKNLDTASPGTHRTSRRRTTTTRTPPSAYCSSASSLMYEACKNSKFSPRLKNDTMKK
jgi:hypothetical protein